MSDGGPSWLTQALPHSLGRSECLAIARYGSEKAMERGGFSLKSPAFADGEELDPCFTADEEDSVAPPLEWTAPPPGTSEIALIVEDADSPGDTPACHWLVWGFPGQKGQLLEGETPPRVGKNSQKNSEWLLPAPSPGEPPHHYVFQLFALELPLTLMPGANREALAAEIENNVLACAVYTGTYVRSEDDDDAWDEDWDGDRPD